MPAARVLAPNRTTVMIVRDGSFFIDRIQVVRASQSFEYRERLDG